MTDTILFTDESWHELGAYAFEGQFHGNLPDRFEMLTGTTAPADTLPAGTRPHIIENQTDFVRRAPVEGSWYIRAINPPTSASKKLEMTYTQITQLDSALQDPIHGVKIEDKLQTFDGSVPAASSAFLVGVTGPSQVHFHIVDGDYSQGDFKLLLWEDAIELVPGTEVAKASNMKFTSSQVSEITIRVGSTFTSYGNLRADKYFPSAGNKTGAGGGIAGGRILKPNSIYVFEIKNLDPNTPLSFGSVLIWSEAPIAV